MKKKISAIFIVCLFIITLILPINAKVGDNPKTYRLNFYADTYDEYYSLKYNYQYTINESVEANGFIYNGTVHLPFTEVLKAIGSSYYYDYQERAVKITTIEGDRIVLGLNQRTVRKNDQSITLTNPTVSVNGKSYITGEVLKKVFALPTYLNKNDINIFTGFDMVENSGKRFYRKRLGKNPIYLMVPNQKGKLITESPTESEVPEDVKQQFEGSSGKLYISRLTYAAPTENNNWLFVVEHTYEDKKGSEDIGSYQAYFNTTFYANPQQTTLKDTVDYVRQDMSKIKMINGNQVILDGQNQITVVDDQTGKVIKTYDLKAIFSCNFNSYYDYYDGNYIIARCFDSPYEQYKKLDFKDSIYQMNGRYHLKLYQISTGEVIDLTEYVTKEKKAPMLIGFVFFEDLTGQEVKMTYKETVNSGEESFTYTIK